MWFLVWMPIVLQVLMVSLALFPILLGDFKF